MTAIESVAAIEGARLRTLTQGEGPPLVLCHGGPGAWDYLGRTAAMIDDLTTVYRYDQRACGASTGEPPFDVATFVADLEALRVHWDHGSWIVGGHSWGATLALLYALTHPDRVRALIYLSGTGIADDWHDEYRAERLRRLDLSQRGEAEHLRARMDHAAGAELDALDMRYRRLMAPTEFADHRNVTRMEAAGEFDRPANRIVNRSVGGDTNRIVRERDLASELAGLRVPALVVHGAADPRPHRGARQVADFLPNAEFRLLPNCGHELDLEQPEALRRTLRRFLKRVVI